MCYIGIIILNNEEGDRLKFPIGEYYEFKNDLAAIFNKDMWNCDFCKYKDKDDRICLVCRNISQTIKNLDRLVIQCELIKSLGADIDDQVFEYVLRFSNWLEKKNDVLELIYSVVKEIIDTIGNRTVKIYLEDPEKDMSDISIQIECEELNDALKIVDIREKSVEKRASYPFFTNVLPLI